MVEDITMSIIYLAENKGIDIIFDTDIEEKLMVFDGDKIERVILNVLSNALKFTDRGGKIYVTVMDKVDNVEISVKSIGVSVSAILLLSICEIINMLMIKYLFKADLTTVFSNPISKTIYGIPSLLLFILSIIIINVVLNKNKFKKEEIA